MPYIKSADRDLYDSAIEAVVSCIEDTATPSNLVDLVAQAIRDILLGSYEKWLPNYADYNEIIGVIECAKLEFLLRKAAKASKPLKFDTVDKTTSNALKRRTNKLVKSILQWYEGECSSTSGQLNYIITRMLKLLNRSGNIVSPVALLDAVKLDIYQREVIPYERQKEDENGSVIDNFLK